MRRVVLALLLAPAAAHAQPASDQPPDIVVTRPVGRSDVGRFLRDKDGGKVGSLYAVYGDTAVVWLGFGGYGNPGNHLVVVPLSALQGTGGGITADVAALEALPEYKPRCADLLCFSTLPPEPPTVAR